MTEPEAPSEAERRYLAAIHAVQSGVAYKMQHDPGETTPKHLRVGVNSAHVSTTALVGLLADKGVLTLTEFQEYLAREMEAERDRYQDWLNTFYGGVQVKLV